MNPINNLQSLRNNMIHIPEGDVGSINYWTKKAVDDVNHTAMQIFDNTGLCLNVISNLQQYADIETALWFAKKVIKLNEK